MRVTIDDEEFSLDNLDGDTGKAAIFSAAKKDAASRGLVITGIDVDGERVDEEAFLVISGGIDVHFTTQPIRELVCDSLIEGENYFKLLIPGLEAVAQMLEAKQTNEALARFAQAIEGISWLVSVFSNSCLLLGTKLDSLKSGDFDSEHKELTDSLESLNEAVESGKYLEMAYCIRENVVPSLKNFSKYWSEISQLASSTIQ